MLTAYLFCVVLGGGFAILSAFGDLFSAEPRAEDGGEAGIDSDSAGSKDDQPAQIGRAAAVFSLRSLVYSLLGFGVTGAILTWLGAGPGAPLTLGFAVLAGLLVGGALGSWLALLKRFDARRRARRASSRAHRRPDTDGLTENDD